MENIDKFEKYLYNKRQHTKDMLSIVKEEFSRYCLEADLELLEDIIHHYELFVKGKTSNGLGVLDE